jgi:arsenate reductase
MPASPEERIARGRRGRVLFLCTGNSARSQMAEWMTNHFLGEHWEAHSAGTAPSGYVHPLAVEALAEIGVGVSRLRSKSVEEFRGEAFDLVLTLCDEAAERCPLWLGGGALAHISFPDPAGAAGPRAERLEAFRRVRDAIRGEVLSLLRPMQISPELHRGFIRR